MKQDFDSDAGDLTVQYYNRNAEAYASHTCKIDLTHLYRPFLSHVPVGGHILDVGSGSGRDTMYFLGRGFKVTAIDASAAMAEISTKRTGQRTLVYRIQDAEWVESFDAVWASASLLHVPRQQTPDALERLARALKWGGTLYASWKAGATEVFDGDRFFCHYTRPGLGKLFDQVPSLHVHSIWQTEDPLRADVTWIHALALKQHA